MNENILQSQINQILEIVKSHDERFNEVDGRFDVLSEQIRQLEKQHGERLAKLEAMTLKLEAMILGNDKRMDGLDKRMDRLADNVNRLGDNVNRLVDRVDSMYKWVIGLILGISLPMWASIIIAILLKK
ncbi:MAG: hypothetical protein ACE5PV_11040 [Candidatus Poribacteria bacterium]